MKKTYVVTGATGFIGGALTKRLLQDGHRVYGVDISEERLNSMKQYGDLISIVADFSTYDALAQYICNEEIDVFYHFAWQGVFGEAFKDYTLQLNNANFCCEALMQAKKLNCKKFVLAGTYNEYEIQNFIRSKEFTPRFTCIYSSAKLISELMCKTLAFNYGIEYSAGLICMAYGENNNSHMLANIVLTQLNDGVEPKLIEGNNFYDMIYIDDIVSGFIAIGESGKNQQSYYIGHRKLKTFKELFTGIRDIVNPCVRLNFGAYHDTVDMDYSLIDLDALYNDTGFECQADFKESILKTAQWLKTRKKD